MKVKTPFLISGLLLAFVCILPSWDGEKGVALCKDIVSDVKISPTLTEKEKELLTNLVSHAEGENAKMRQAELTIQPQRLQQKQQQDKHLQLIDVRSSADFAGCRIRSSLNMPLFTIKTKQFLRDRSIVLVNEGYNYQILEQAVEELKENGFKQPKILAGGLVNWRDTGGKLEGDFFAGAALNEIPSDKFFRDAAYTDWYIFYLTAGQEQGKQMDFSPRVTVLSKDNVVKSVSLLQAYLEEQRLDSIFPYLLIIMDGSKEELRKLKRAVRNAGLSNVYYLVDGLQGYQQFLATREKMRQPGELIQKKCATCP